MGPRSKREYLESICPRYRAASKKEKRTILNEFCLTYKCHRKHAIRQLNKFKRFTQSKPGKRGKPSVYNKPYIIEPLKRIWLAANLPCASRLHAILPLWLPFYGQECGGLSLEAIKALRKISSASIGRILKPLQIKYKTRGRSTTKPGTLLRKLIPVKTNQWDETKPGFVEADTVAHCGESTDGIYVNTLDIVDIATGWSEQRAVWGKGATDVLAQIRHIESLLPFALRGFDSDNGSEFLNWHLVKYCAQKHEPIQFTRSRAYHSDDNAHIEQKNWTHVRQWIGYDRLDDPGFVPLLNELYTAEWRLFHNFFCPSVKLIDKKRIASKIVKKYDSPKTPYQRILESTHVPDAIKRSLKEQFTALNPFKLRAAMEKKLEKIFCLLRRIHHS